MTHTEVVIDHHYSGLNPVQFGYEACASSHAFGPAVRTYWLLHYVLSGFGTFEREGTSYQVGPGEIFVISPYTETYYEADFRRPWNYIWIGFTTDNELPEALSKPVFHCSGAGAVFEEMKKCKSMDNGRSAFLSGCLWKLMALFLEQGKANYDPIDKALHYMHAEYMNPITIRQIAEHMNLDRCYFSTAFAKRVGIPPQQYLIHLRLNKAAELMITHGEAPSTAATSVGYTDLYQFSKMFKQYFGMSPRAYIRQHCSVTRLH